MIKNKKEKIILLLTLSILGIFVLSSHFSKAKTKPYYSGDAINFQGQIYIGSTNTDKFELFVLENGEIFKKNIISSYDNESSVFYDLQFSEENEKLYVYLVNGRYLYKYDISDPINPVLSKKIKDNSWDWFTGLDKIGDKIITFGTNGIKIWNYDFVVINSYNILNEYHYNIGFSKTMDFIFNIKDEKLLIYDTNMRQIISELTLSIQEKRNRKSFYDSLNEIVYVVDDEYLKQINLNGEVINSFKHISNLGYDVDGLEGEDYFYFSDGVGVVKMNKQDLKPIDWAYTTGLGVSGGWAVGLEVVKDNNGEKIIIFNGLSILILDDNLDMVDYYEAKEEDDEPIEFLYLSVDKNRAAPNSFISLRGGGYGLNEKLLITFANEEIEATADSSGRFQKLVQVPSVLPVRTDIKVSGLNSGLCYSLGFEIE